MSIPTAVFLGLFPGVAAQDARSGGSPGDLVFKASLRGPVHPWKEVELPAPVSAIVKDVAVKETELIKTGQLLVQLDDDIPKSDVDVKAIEVDYAQVQYEQAQVDSDISQDLLKQGAGGEGEARRAEVAAKARKMAVEVARKQLAASKVQLDQYHIKAPFDGEVQSIKAEKGARLNPGDPALKVVSRYRLEARLDLPVVLMKQLEVGRDYTFEAGEPVNAKVVGKLKSVDRNINYATRKFRCVFTILNDDLQLPSGFEANLIWPQP